MIAIVKLRLPLFLRLVLVVALAGYMLPTVSFAMHGTVGASFATMTAQLAQTSSHTHDLASGNHEHDDDDDVSEHHSDNAAQDCCTDFCLNLALVSEASEIHRNGTSPVLKSRDAARVVVEPISLNRPPQFRA